MDESLIDPPFPAKQDPAKALAKFGAFEVRLDTGELRKYGVHVRLQRRSFFVLRALLDNPGQVVSRDDLRARLWSNGTFVDFESGLNTAVNRLRSALGDSAETPVYIETLARMGYRFVAPVSFQPSAPPNVSRIYKNGEPSSNHVATAEPIAPAASFAGIQKDVARPLAPPRGRVWETAAIAAVALMLGIVVVAALLLKRPSPTYHQLTFSKENIQNARFTPDGRHIAYSSTANSKLPRLFLTGYDRTGPANPKALDLGVDVRGLAGVSPTGEIAFFPHNEVLDRLPVQSISPEGGTPRSLLENAYSVDWSADGKLAFIVETAGTFTIEFPAGHKLYQARNWIDSLRISPLMDQVAFIEHPIPNDDAGRVVIVDRAGKARTLSDGWESIEGLAWRPAGDEVWFTAAASGVNRKLMAVDMKGKVRQVAEMPVGMVVRDINRSGDTLIVCSSSHMSMLRGSFDDKSSQDISLFDWSRAVAISGDGKLVLFDESGQGGGSSYSVFLHRAGQKSPERVGEGRAMDLSSDGLWALTQKSTDPASLTLISLRDHRPAQVGKTGLEYAWARFLNDGNSQEIIAAGNYPGQKRRLFRQQLPDGAPIQISKELDLSNPVIAGDGHSLAGKSSSGLIVIDLASHIERAVSPPQRVTPLAFLSDGRLITSRREGDSIVVETLELATGTLEPYGEVALGDGAEITEITPLRLAQDGRAFAYSRVQSLSTLFVVSGWK